MQQSNEKLFTCTLIKYFLSQYYTLKLLAEMYSMCNSTGNDQSGAGVLPCDVVSFMKLFWTSVAFLIVMVTTIAVVHHLTPLGETVLMRSWYTA